MDPFTLLIAAFVVAGMARALPAALVDAFVTARAAKAGQWDLIDRDRQRRATRVPMAERWASAWSARRKARHVQAGGSGTYRPGAKAYAADLYHGFWEDKLDKRTKRREARPPYVHDPDRPTWDERLTARIGEKVDRLRAARGQRLPEPEPVDKPEPVTYPPGTVTFDEHGQQVPLGPPPIEQQPVNERKNDIPDPDFQQVKPMSREQAARDASNAGVRGDRRRRGQCSHFGDFGGWVDDTGLCTRRVCGHDRDGAGVADGYCCGHTTFGPHVNRYRNAERNFQRLEKETPMQADTAVVATEVNNNEDARRMFTRMRDAATELAQAAELAEQARRELAELANSGADGMAAKAFDAGAVSAIANARDAVDLGTVGDWAEKADVIGAEAQSGLAALDKYRDAEAQVAENQIDPSTLAATSS